MKRYLKWIYGLVSAMAVGAASSGLWYIATVPLPVTPLDARFGLHPNHAALAKPIVAASLGETAKLRVVAAVEDNSKKNVRLWDAVRAIECPGKPRGKDWPNVAQTIGDCVSHGHANGCNHAIAIEAVRHGSITGPPRICSEWLYHGGRVVVGKNQIRGDGCVGAWSVEGVSLIGLLTRGDLDVGEYDGQRARLWGKSRPPEKYFPVAAQRKPPRAAPVRSAAEARDAIAGAGTPVTIASNFGFDDTNYNRSCPVRFGRRVAVWNGSWQHQMCLIAYDGSAGEPLFYCLNSWGEAWGPEPMQNEPRGGFWMTWKDVDRICKQGDSWAIPGADGFQTLDLDVFALRTKTPAQRSKVHGIVSTTQKELAL